MAQAINGEELIRIENQALEYESDQVSIGIFFNEQQKEKRWNPNRRLRYFYTTERGVGEILVNLSSE